MNEITISNVLVKYDDNGRVYWMSDWSQCHQFKMQGYFTMKFYKNCFGHVDYYIAK